jgi:hypothetical protein
MIEISPVSPPMTQRSLPPAAGPAGSIVGHASRILQQEQAGSRGAASSSNSWYHQRELPVVSELEQYVRGLREQLQDITDNVTRLMERLPTEGLAGLPMRGTSSAQENPAQALRVEAADLPLLRRAEAMPGSIAKAALGVVNGGATPATVVLRATSLINEQGDELPSTLVQFTPNPIVLSGGSEHPVEAHVRIPNGTRPGTYTGLVQAIGLAATRALLFVDVKPANIT